MPFALDPSKFTADPTAPTRVYQAQCLLDRLELTARADAETVGGELLTAQTLLAYCGYREGPAGRPTRWDAERERLAPLLLAAVGRLTDALFGVTHLPPEE